MVLNEKNFVCAPIDKYILPFPGSITRASDGLIHFEL